MKSFVLFTAGAASATTGVDTTGGTLCGASATLTGATASFVAGTLDDAEDTGGTLAVGVAPGVVPGVVAKSVVGVPTPFNCVVSDGL